VLDSKEAAAMQDMPDPSADLSLHEGYRLKVAPSPARLRAIFNGETIADSADVLVMRETNYPPVYYFPRKDVAMHLLVPTDQRSHCPFKGNANYWTLRVADREVENIAWSYEDPFDEATLVKDHIALYWDKMDEWLIDEQPMPAPVRSNQQSTNPLVPWLVDQAWRAQTAPELLAILAEALRNAEFPLWRARIMIQTLNPLLFARGYTWQQDIDGIVEFQATHAGVDRPQYQDSPFAAIIRGEGGIRRRLEGDTARLDYPILEELITEGATDYVAMSMRFTDGQINILVLVSNQPDGFSTEQLGHLYQILPNLSRLLEAHAQRSSARSLLQTYLGQGAGDMVMEGHVKRGDAEELEAIILMSDLRDSTSLAEMLPKDDYLAALNDYFDCVAGAVIANGGDVLKYIGDAVLAIFPIEHDATGCSSAFDRALAALQDANQRMDEVNVARQTRANAPPLRFGTGVHSGHLTFGNVGTQGRLDFTVIGSGVNQAARLASLCKTLGETVIISKAVADHAAVSVKSLGHHELRGIRERQELFTLS
jgi:adenylate cyclase